MNYLNPFGTGRIGEIIAYLQEKYKTENISEIPVELKLKALCDVLQLETSEFDILITSNSPVLRTITGHAFEIVFDSIIKKNGYISVEVGGDGDVDRIVNNVTLQLKTPNKAGTKGKIAQYKTHKTHGPKSEAESEGYYHSVHDFAEYFVGLISYEPFCIIFIHKDELPTHSKFSDRIKSPFNINWAENTGLNNFSLIGIENLNLDTELFAFTVPEIELLPLSSFATGLKTEIIIDTILNQSNFRIWDMNMRGFSREFSFRRMLKSKGIAAYNASESRTHRADKADLAMLSKDGTFKFMQMKGLSVGACCFEGNKSKVAIETQLTRGRYNDHATQSRLYLVEDFDFLIIGVDPSVAQKLQLEIGNTIPLTWEFYAIPAEKLAKYSKYAHRFNYMQKFLYSDIQEFLIDDNWLSQWQSI